jgi:uncharacterized protein (TIGR03067 family)
MTPRSVLIPSRARPEINVALQEFIMKCAQTDHRQASQTSRLVFTAGLVLLVLVTGLTAQSRSKADDDAGRTSSIACTDAQSDQEKMQGKWTILHCEFAGRDEMLTEVVEDTISDARWLRPKRRTAEYRLKLDPTKDPKWVDLSADRLGDQTLKGIYSLDGDRLTICYCYDPELPRPTEFKTMPGVNGYIYVLERVK